MTHGQTVMERRAHPRLSVTKNGVFTDKSSGISLYCEVIDLSAGGARIRLASSFVLSDRAELVILSDAVSRQVRVVWRSGNQIGLLFEGEPKPVKEFYR